MSQKETHAAKTDKSLSSNLVPPEFAAIGKERLEELVTMQTELFQELQDMNRKWFDLLQSETTLATECCAKLTTARSLPETATICQDWFRRQMVLAAEDAKRLLSDSQKFVATGARFLSNGWLPNGRGGST